MYQKTTCTLEDCRMRIADGTDHSCRVGECQIRIPLRDFTMSKKEFNEKFEKLRDSGVEKIGFIITNEKMKQPETILFSKVDFDYKQKFINEAYNDKCEHVMNTSIKLIDVV